jgi:ABC-type multidrug transport system ATPase subunit
MEKNMKRTPGPVVMSLRQVVVERGAFKLSVKSMDLRRGEIACLVGTNGCGKTTLLLTALGMMPHRGKCTLNGLQYDGSNPRLRAQIGFIADDADLLLEELTAHEQWSVTTAVLGKVRSDAPYTALMRRAEQLAREISFTPPAQIARHYSHGMRKKTQIVTALLGRPDLIVIDELRNGLDPIAIRQSEGILKREQERGAAILVATHDLRWAERFADYLYVLEGKIIAQGPVNRIVTRSEPDLETAFYRLVKADVCD